MKIGKKVSALLLALIVALGVSVAAFAANDGTITIENTVKDQKYTIYKVFDLTYATSGGTTTVAYTYTKSGDTDTLYTALTGKDSPFELEESGVKGTYDVSLKDDSTTGAEIADFLGGLVENKTLTTSIESVKATGTSVKFEDLAYGYYYVESTLGTAVGLDSTTPDVTIEEKNEEPDVEKKVEEDGSLGEENTAGIGDKVYYTTTITAKPGAENYVLHDTMTEGLDFNEDVVVKVGESALTEDTDYTVSTSCSDKCTFEIAFTQVYLDSIDADTTITVTYSATVNEKAVIDGAGNTNETYLKYGEENNGTSTTKTTTTYVFDVDVLKYTGDDDNPTPLPGAGFVLYKTVTEEGKSVNYYAQVTDDKLTGWTKTKSEADTLTSDDDGKISVEGLDADTYYLEETVAPTGYNKLSGPVSFEITDDGHVKIDGAIQEDDLVQIKNQAGNALPSTGGIGTTIFYVVGSILVIGAAILLITKKRMKGSAE